MTPADRLADLCARYREACDTSDYPDASPPRYQAAAAFRRAVDPDDVCAVIDQVRRLADGYESGYAEWRECPRRSGRIPMTVLWRAVMAVCAGVFFGAAAVCLWQSTSAGLWRELDRREREKTP